MTLDRLARLLSEEPAKLAGLAGRKGKLAPGYDADIVVRVVLVVGLITCNQCSQALSKHQCQVSATARSYGSTCMCAWSTSR